MSLESRLIREGATVPLLFLPVEDGFIVRIAVGTPADSTLDHRPQFVATDDLPAFVRRFYEECLLDREARAAAIQHRLESWEEPTSPALAGLTIEDFSI